MTLRAFRFADADIGLGTLSVAAVVTTCGCKERDADAADITDIVGGDDHTELSWRKERFNLSDSSDPDDVDEYADADADAATGTEGIGCS